MLPPTFKDDVRELIALAKECPESLQEKCLQILLDDYLIKSSATSRNAPKPPAAPDPANAAAQDNEESAEAETLADDRETPAGQRDVVMTDLHLKAKKFLTQYSLSLDDINQLFFMEGIDFKPLYEDLKTTKASETQIRIGLLQALRAGMKGGEFQFNGEDVRTECQERKAYDGKNFSANFQNSASLFVGFDKYEKTTPLLKLTEAGKQRLAETIRELK
jgi:hypothetical protein